MSFSGSPALRAAASRSAESSASSCIRTAAVSPMAITSSSQSSFGPPWSRAVIPPAAIATASSDIADQIEGDFFSSLTSACLASRISILVAALLLQRHCRPAILDAARIPLVLLRRTTTLQSHAHCPGQPARSRCPTFTSHCFSENTSARLLPSRSAASFPAGRSAHSIWLILHPPTNPTGFQA